MVPVRNGEKRIAATIASLEGQSAIPSRIIVICDNCTDKTEEVVCNLQDKYSNLEVLVTKNNRAKKAGALNQAFKLLMKEGQDSWQYALMMDDDTIIDKKLISAGLETLGNDRNIGAVCSRAGVFYPADKLSLSQKILWHMQHIEYGLFFDSSRVQTLGHIKVVHGMAAIYSREALEAVVKFRERVWNVYDQVYCEGNITEDYELTIVARRAGYQVTMNPMMKAWTDVPLSLKKLWSQRIRWLLGGIDALARHGINKVTYKEYIQHSLFLVFFGFTVYILAWMIQNIISNGEWSWHPITFVIIGIMYLDYLYRARYIQDCSAGEWFVVALFVPFSLYHMLYQIEQLVAYGKYGKAWLLKEDIKW